MEQKKRETLSLFSAAYNVDCCKKAGDTPQVEKEGLNEDGNESLDEKIQTSFSEKQTAEKMFSEECVWDQLPSKRFHRLPHKASSASASSTWSLHDDDSRHIYRRHPSTPLPSPPPQQRKKHLLSAPFVRNIARLQSEQSLDSLRLPHKQLVSRINLSYPVYSRKTQGEVGGNTDEVLPKKTAYHDPDTDHFDTSLPFEPSHEMSDTQYVSEDISAQQRYQEMLSKLDIHCLSNFSNPSIATPFSAEYDTSSCKTKGDEQQTEKENLNEYVNEPSKEHLESLTSISEKQTAEKKFVHNNARLQSEQSPNSSGFHNLLLNSLRPGLSSAPRTADCYSISIGKGVTSLSHITSAKIKTQAGRSSDMLKTIYEESKPFHTSAAAAAPGVNQDITRELEHAYEEACFLVVPSLESDQILQIPKNKDTEDGGPRQNRPAVFQENKLGEDSDVLEEIEPPVPAVISSVTNTQPTHPDLQTSSDPVQSERSSSCLPRSHSVPSLSQTTSAKNKTFTRSQSSPDLLFKPSCEEFTPDITVDGNDETYRFQCSCPGLYQCSVTGLLFHMEGEGDVVYRIVPWNRRLLARHHKQPAGPLFDIKCLQQSVCQLHLPHCEIRSTGGCEFMSVAHVNDEGIEFIGPQKITETHLVINITGFSGFGTVKDEDSAPDPVRALVLLFYRPPADPDAESLLNVLLLPRNVVLRDVLRTRKKLNGDEIYIETSPHCKLQPKQEYTLSTCPADDSVLVQPTEAEFDCDNYDNYFPSFQVTLETMRKHMQLFLRDTNSSHSVWERRVCLTGVKSSCGPSALNLSSDKRLLDVRSSFIDGISGPVLKSLLDKLFEKTVIAEAERESADEMQNRTDKARFVIDTVRKKGEAASSEMIEFLCEADPFLCEHLGLI